MLAVKQNIHAHITAIFGIENCNIRGIYLKELRQDGYFDNLQHIVLAVIFELEFSSYILFTALLCFSASNENVLLHMFY